MQSLPFGSGETNNNKSVSLALLGPLMHNIWWPLGSSYIRKARDRLEKMHKIQNYVKQMR